MKSLHESALKLGAHLVEINRSGVKFYEISSTQLESLINEVISQRLGEPVRYMVERFSEGMHEKEEYFTTKESAYENARWGYNETKVTPLYSLNIES